jgi:hypothetical protein
MKLSALIIAFLLIKGFTTVSAQTATAGAVITWDQDVYDFGEIIAGEKVEHTFRFSNTGTEPLVITNVQVTCGCTTPKGWPRDPIAPGKKAELVVQFNSTGKIGRQNKVVTVISNAVGGNSQVTFTATVLEKKAPN